MSDKNISEYFVWEEKSLIGQLTNCECNGVYVVNDTIKNTVKECVGRKEKGIKRTEKERRNSEYLKRKYKKRNRRILLKKHECNTIDEYKIKKEHRNHTRKEERRRYKIKYKKIHYFKHICKLHNKRSVGGYKLIPIELWGLLKRQRMLCKLTGRRLNRDNISLDHIVPLSKGGSNDPSNIRFVHMAANRFKMDISDNDLLELAKDIVKTIGDSAEGN